MTTLLRLPQVQNEGQPAITGILFRWQSLLPPGGDWWSLVVVARALGAIAAVYRLAACFLALAGGGTFFLPFFGGLALVVGSSISPFSLTR